MGELSPLPVTVLHVTSTAMSMEALKKALFYFEEPPSSFAKCMKVDAMSAGIDTTKKPKKKKVHKSVVEKIQAGQRKNYLDDNLQALQMFASKRKAATSGHINDIMKSTSNSKKKFIFGKKHNAKKKKKVTQKSAFDEGDFENFFKEYHGLKK